MRPNKLKYYSSHMIHVELYSAHGSVNSLSYGIKSLYVNYDMYVCMYVWSEHNLHISMARCYRGNNLPFNHFLHAMLYTNQLTQHLLHVHVVLHVVHNTSRHCIYAYMLLHVHVAQYILLLYICIHVVTCTCCTIHPAIVYMHTCCYMYMLHNTSCYCIYTCCTRHLCIHVVTCTTCSTRHMFPAWLPDNCMKDQGRLSGHFIYYILKYNPSIVVTNSWLE